ncbi:MAG: sensor histidine kinase [Solidesulfovibrio sp. DCME]|uniref:sensor histidine kinase n=1 Tax=Solidesulfovibrio sp. DCME TaxID=3447380 RepID=UPI003D0F67BF
MENFFFKVNAELKNVVGRDLINDDNIAVIELVKNSYDAGSPSVSIDFLDINYPGQLVIKDYGCGMSLDDIKHKWLNIAYSEKREFHPKDRIQAGNKGVGRFSCDRLGEHLDLYTHKAGDKYIHLKVFWERFENAEQDKQIMSVPVDYEEVPLEVFKNKAKWETVDGSGTTLIIARLRSKWDRAKLLSLRRDLERFANPNQGFQKNSFSIFLDCAQLDSADNPVEESKRVSGLVKNTVFRNLGFRTSYIEAAIDHKGDNITTELYHRGERLFTLIEKNNYKNLKDINIVIYFLNQYHKAYFHRSTGMSSIDYGSIFLFLNGFRVSPYGNRGNDWLRLDNRKAQGMKKLLGAREVLGRIEVNDHDGQWRIISSREGVVKSRAFEELTNTKDGFFYSVHKKLEKYVVQGLAWDRASQDVEVEKLAGKLLVSGNEIIGEKYIESENVKEKRILDVLVALIAQGTKSDDIQLLEFDPRLIEMLGNQQETEAKEFIERFEQVAVRIDAEPQANLKSFLTKAAERMREMKGQRDEARSLVLKTNVEKIQAIRQRDEAIRFARQREEENLFLKASRNRDVDDVIDLSHQILTWSTTIENDISKSIRIISSPEVDRQRLLVVLRRISSLNNKILKVAKLITLANFRVKALATDADLCAFIVGYIEEVRESQLFPGFGLELLGEYSGFVVKFKPLEIIILIDSFISNSQKAGAQHLYVRFIDEGKSALSIVFDDDGHGIAPEIADPESVFERGVTTTNGSGIGLYHARQIVSSIGGSLVLTESHFNGFALLMRIIK